METTEGQAKFKGLSPVQYRIQSLILLIFLYSISRLRLALLQLPTI